MLTHGPIKFSRDGNHSSEAKNFCTIVQNNEEYNNIMKNNNIIMKKKSLRRSLTSVPPIPFNREKYK